MAWSLYRLLIYLNHALIANILRRNNIFWRYSRKYIRAKISKFTAGLLQTTLQLCFRQYILLEIFRNSYNPDSYLQSRGTGSSIITFQTMPDVHYPSRRHQ